MADVKWIKIVTDIFDDEKILMIETLPSSDSIIVIWFKLLCFAGKTNNDGVFLMNNRIAYTDEMLSAIFRRDVNTVRMALKIFEQYGMIEVIDNVITIPNWNKHQTLDAYDKKKERDRIYQKERRKKQRLLIEKSSDTSSDTYADTSPEKSSDVAVSEEDKEEEKDIDIDIDKEREKKIDYQLIADMYNDTCVSFPHIKKLSESRKKAIKARLKTYTVDDFRTLFQKAEASDFLKGKNDRNWIASFDWMIKDSNMAKVLDGNYDNRENHGSGKKRQFNNFEQRTYDYDALQRMLSSNQAPPKTAADDENIRARAEALKHSLA